MKIMRIDFDGVVKRFRVTGAESETIRKFLILEKSHNWSVCDILEDVGVTVEFEDIEDIIDF